MVSNCTTQNNAKIPRVSPAPFKSAGIKKERAPNSQIKLLKFIHETIESGQHSDKIIWINEEKTAFRFLDQQAFTVLYRAVFNNPNQIWDNIARLLRFNRANGLISNVPCVSSAFSFNYSIKDILEDRVILNKERSSPLSPKTPKSSENNEKRMRKEELKIGTVGCNINQNGTDTLAHIGNSRSIMAPLLEKRKREASKEEMESILKELKANLTPFDAFLRDNKKIKKLDFGQQIQIYIKHCLQSNSLPVTQNLMSQFSQKASIEH